MFLGDGSFPNGKGYSFSGIASFHASSCFTGAIFVNSSNIVLKGETVFANNTDYLVGGKTVNVLFDEIQVTGVFFQGKTFWYNTKRNA